MTKIKICGLSRSQDIQAVNEALPDYIGFVFAKSRRQVSLKQAEKLKSLIDSRILTVGVFVNASSSEIARICKDNIIDIIQLHGDEDENYITELRNMIKNPIIKAIKVQNSRKIHMAQSLPCDYLLFDTYKKDIYGGSGESFDHSLISDVRKPYFLAGGLNAENIAAAITECQPYCVDISSGVETDGLKDKEKIKEIIKIVRSEAK